MNTIYKTLNSIIFSIFLSISLVQAMFSQGYNPFRDQSENIFQIDFLQKTYDQNHYVSTRIDSVQVNFSTIEYFPYKTIRANKPTDINCSHFDRHSWMGRRIEYSLIDNSIRFEHFAQALQSPGAIDSNSVLILYPGHQPGVQWQADQLNSINGVVVGTETWLFENITDDAVIIKLTNSNEDYDWDSIDIRISENYGLIDFVDLRYFPTVFIPVNLMGTSNPPNGVQDYTLRDIYHMMPGDKYQAEYKFGYDGLDKHYIEEFTCLQVLNDFGDIVERTMKHRKIKYDIFSNSWTETDNKTYNEIVDYSKLYPYGLTDQITPYNDDFIRTQFSDKYKYAIALYKTQVSPCYYEFTDQCIGFTFKKSFAKYFDCPYFTRFDSYLPIYISAEGEETGTEIDFDEILSNKKIVKADVKSISPNPTSGLCRIELAQPMLIEAVFVMNLLGQRFSVPFTSDGTSINSELSDLPSGMYSLFALTGGDNNLSMYHLGKVSVLH